MSVNQFHMAALRWYFTEYESDIGYSAFDPSSVGLGGGGDPNYEAIFRAVQRGRRIATVLRELTPEQQRVIALVHEPVMWPAHLCGGYDATLHGIICSMEHDPRGRSKKAWAMGVRDRAHEAFTEAAKRLGLMKL